MFMWKPWFMTIIIIVIHVEKNKAGASYANQRFLIRTEWSWTGKTKQKTNSWIGSFKAKAKASMVREWTFIRQLLRCILAVAAGGMLSLTEERRLIFVGHCDDWRKKPLYIPLSCLTRRGLKHLGESKAGPWRIVEITTIEVKPTGDKEFSLYTTTT